MADKIIEFMKKATEAYEAGSPIISDAEYDALERKYGQLLHSTASEIEHLNRMYSLKKHYTRDGDAPLNTFLCVKTPKLDGAAVSLLYVNGELQLALTRGDGVKGRDITEKLRKIAPNRLKIASTKPTQITGEVVALKSVPNSRNFASGALNLKELSDFESRVLEGSIIFVAYGVSPTEHDTYEQDMSYLSQLGFNVATDNNYDEYPTDGLVYRLNSNSAFLAAGATDKFPHGAFALKEQEESVVTTLLDVSWATGKSGKVTPTAILEPVMIGDALISRATLNNIAYIEALDLEIGCKVEVVRAGEIIPRIIGRV